MVLWRLFRLAFIVAVLALPLGSGAHADNDGYADEEGGDADHDRARDLLENGEIEPLRAIIARVSAKYPGEIVKIALNRKHGRWIYRFRVLAVGGNLLEVEVDAKSMEVIREEDED